MASLAIASAAASTAAQSQAANRTAAYQNNQYNQVASAASESYSRQTGVLSNRVLQENQVQGQQAQASTLAIEQARAATTVQAGERGFSGNTVNTLFSDFNRQESQNNFALKTNQEWMQSQYGEQASGLRAEAQSRIAGVVPQPIASPSGLGLALQVGTAVAGGFDKDQQLTARGPYNPNGSPNSNASFWYKPLFSS